jgi:hypothetical protein
MSAFLCTLIKIYDTVDDWIDFHNVNIQLVKISNWHYEYNIKYRLLLCKSNQCSKRKNSSMYGLLKEKKIYPSLSFIYLQLLTQRKELYLSPLTASDIKPFKWLIFNLITGFYSFKHYTSVIRIV